MIAVHSALYIFRPRASTGEVGLYPYRHYAYLIWFLFPVTMASLAFINGNDAYVDQKTYCYLPVRPFWYRLALSWIPRYLIFLFILGIYVSIYCHVRNKFNGFEEQDKIRATHKFSTASVLKPSKRVKQHNIPPTSPTFVCHDLIPHPSRRTSVTTDAAADVRNPSVLTIASDNGAPLGRTGTTRFIWASVFANDGSASEDPPSDLSTVDSDSFTGHLTTQPLPAYLGGSLDHHNLESHRRVMTSDIESVGPSRSRITLPRDDFITRVTFDPNQTPNSKPSKADIISILHRGPPDMETESTTSVSQLQLVNSRGQNPAVSEMLRTREKIRRQLRLSFIYPLVYMGMWIVPFVSHVLQYDDRFAVYPPFGLTCVATISTASQAAVDCWLFSTREKPWKHIHGSEGSFWGSLKFWSGWHGVRRKRRQGPGKTREEMVREARAAYKRREDELAQKRLEVVQGVQTGEHRRERTWWEIGGVDDAVDTVQEETVDPIGDVQKAAPRSSTGPSREVSEEKPRTEEESTSEPTRKLSETKEFDT
jgi:G protein-coupled receptor GPR1